ncbi:MAG: extracellular solute-binding protein [Spirochaetia bacterium]|nr:extracellular solute-binding protein [Spirochaetia bacterium]
MKNTNLKILTAVLVFFVIMTFSLSAQGKQEEEDGQVTITVWDWFYGSDGSQGDLAEAIDEAFEAKYPDINVNHEAVSHPPYDVYAASMAAGEGADVMLIHANGQNFQDMADSLVVIDDYIEDMRDNFPESVLADTSPDRDVSKGIRGLPISIQGWVWYYNKELFEEAGLDPENPPETWDEFLEACSVLKDYGTVPVGFGEGIHLEMMIAGTLDQVLSMEEKRALFSGEMSFTHPKITNTFAKFRDLFEKGYMDPAGLTTPLLREMGERFMAGESAIFRGFVSDIFNWYEFGNALGGDNVGVIPNFYFEPSSHRNVVGAAGGTGYGVPTYSDNIDAAVKYVKFAASAEGANIMLQSGGGMPANLEADKSLLANEAGREVSALLSENIVPPTKAFIKSSQWNALRQHAPVLITGDITPEEYGKRIDQAR